MRRVKLSSYELNLAIFTMPAAFSTQVIISNHFHSIPIAAMAGIFVYPAYLFMKHIMSRYGFMYSLFAEKERMASIYSRGIGATLHDGLIFFKRMSVFLFYYLMMLVMQSYGEQGKNILLTDFSSFLAMLLILYILLDWRIQKHSKAT